MRFLLSILIVLLQAEEGKGLLVNLDPGRAGRAASKEAVAAQWFSQDLFQDEDLADADEPAVPSSKRTKLSDVAAAGMSDPSTRSLQCTYGRAPSSSSFSIRLVTASCSESLSMTMQHCQETSGKLRGSRVQSPAAGLPRHIQGCLGMCTMYVHGAGNAHHPKPDSANPDSLIRTICSTGIHARQLHLCKSLCISDFSTAIQIHCTSVISPCTMQTMSNHASGIFLKFRYELLD